MYNLETPNQGYFFELSELSAGETNPKKSAERGFWAKIYISSQAAILNMCQEHNVSMTGEAHRAKGSPRLMITSTEELLAEKRDYPQGNQAYKDNMESLPMITQFSSDSNFNAHLFVLGVC